MEYTLEKNWKYYTKIIAEAFFAFYISTFCFIVYLWHRDGSHLVLTIIIACLYLFIFALTLYRLITRLPLAVLMILVPIAPLFALIVVITMIPVLQWM